MRAFLKNHKVVKVLLWIVIVILAIVIFALIFVSSMLHMHVVFPDPVIIVRPLRNTMG